MPAPANLGEFVDVVRKSGLVPEPALAAALDRQRGAEPAGQTVDGLIQLLVREGHLTFFQAKQLKLGRYKRFNIGSKYRLLELLGAGGMGAVYLCEHTLMKRLVALKILPSDKMDDPSSLERFHREARAVAALNHPNIVRAHDIDVHDKLHFLVMEFVDGASLQEIVARHGPMDPIRAAQYVAQSAVGLQHAHELGMVHRDIKPGNLLLDRTGVIKVLDMGLARFFNKSSDNVTEKYDDKCVLGTADYLAPEQAVSSSVDIRADVYSLGGTFYFLLTGQTPFPEGTIASKLVAHQTRDPKPVEEFRSDVPAGMLAVLRKMMAKPPARRYQQPVEVAAALAEWAEVPLGPPPAKEMPALCPAVLALTGHSVDASSTSTPSLARVLFGPGANAFPRIGGGSTAGRSGHASGGTLPGRPPGSVTIPGKRVADRPDGDVPVNAPLSTGRTASVATSPLPVKPAKTPPAPPRPAAARTGLKPARSTLSPAHWVLFGLAGVALFAAGMLAVYFALKT